MAEGTSDAAPDFRVLVTWTSDVRKSARGNFVQFLMLTRMTHATGAIVGSVHFRSAILWRIWAYILASVAREETVCISETGSALDFSVQEHPFARIHGMAEWESEYNGCGGYLINWNSADETYRLCFTGALGDEVRSFKAANLHFFTDPAEAILAPYNPSIDGARPAGWPCHATARHGAECVVS